MKIIINESQLRLIVEGEDNLLDFTPHYENVPADKWDKVFLRIKKSEGVDYYGYYISDDVDLLESNVTELDYLVIVWGWLDLRNSEIKSLSRLSYVRDGLSLYDTPLSKTTTEEELKKQINVGVGIYL